MNAPAEPTPAQQSAARLTSWAVDELTVSEQTEFAAALAADPTLQFEAEATRAFCREFEAGHRAHPVPILKLRPVAREELLAAARRSSQCRVSFWMPSLAAAACFAVMLAVYSQTRARLLSEASKKELAEQAVRASLVDSARKLQAKASESNGRVVSGFSNNFLAEQARKLKLKLEKSEKQLAGQTQDPSGTVALDKSENFQTLQREVATDRKLITAILSRLKESGGSLDTDVGDPLLEQQAAADLAAYERAVGQLTPAEALEVRTTRINPTTGRVEPRPPNVGSQATAITVKNDKSAAPGHHWYFRQQGVDRQLRRGARLYEEAVERESVSVVTDRMADAEGLSAKSNRTLPENPFLAATEHPLSTFSIDVDTASYAIARRHLNQGQRPPAEAVRLEELINYFPMDDAPPVDGKPFAVHVETASAPWAADHRLVRVALKGKLPASATRGAANLVFLVDTSGSMAQPNKLPLVQQSLQLLLTQLEPRDRVSLVTYAGESRIALPPTLVSERAVIATAIDALSSGGSTNGSGGITAAYQQARAHFIPGGVNRVILATDGDFNVGLTSETDLQTLITKEATSGVYLSVLAYGSDNLKDSTAELLADKGNGNYAYIDSLGEARRALVTQMQGTLVTIAKDVKIQVEFNPAQVGRYRLLGYENRALANKDFNDDTKDAGEIGAGHSVTALYEVIPAGAAVRVSTATDPLKYQTPPPAPAPAAALTPQAATGELLTVKLRYQQPEGSEPSQLIEIPVKDPGTPWPQATANFRWTAAVAGYGLLLRGSAHAGDLTWETIRPLATAAKGPDPDGFRGEFLQLIEKAPGLTGTK